MLDSILIMGIVLMPWKMPAGSIEVTAQMGNEHFYTETTENGSFSIKLPHSGKGSIVFNTINSNVIYASPTQKVYFHKSNFITLSVSRKEFIRVKLCQEWIPSPIIDSSNLITQRLNDHPRRGTFTVGGHAIKKCSCSHYHVQKGHYQLVYRWAYPSDPESFPYLSHAVYARIGRRKYAREYTKFADYVVPIEIKNRKTIHLYINQKEPDW